MKYKLSDFVKWLEEKESYGAYTMGQPENWNKAIRACNRTVEIDEEAIARIIRAVEFPMLKWLPVLGEPAKKADADIDESVKSIANAIAKNMKQIIKEVK